MATLIEASAHETLLDRRRRLRHVANSVGAAPDLARLITEVDAALERVDHGTHGLCVVCDESMVSELERHPMGRYCLCDLSERQTRALENDLETAWSIQAGLLPPQDVSAGGWTSHFRYFPDGPVSGDVVDLVTGTDDSLYFLLGDVAGKGVSAALLMAHLGAHFRRLAEEQLPIADIARQLSDKLAERTGPARYVTLATGVAWPDGRVHLANAGHLPPLLTRRGAVERLDATGIPAGLFQGSDYGVHERTLTAGESIVLYTDGLVESTDPEGDEYGIARLSCELESWADQTPDALASTALSSAAAFREGAPAGDDQTLLVLQRR
ncbi:MAG TPA: PP2C family protein-serine/threonine phosphatase [Acidobacteriota bacterium]|nr:PP2C family protein-serine/threonine phosphatase [Acidobacteriota bacterium]